MPAHYFETLDRPDLTNFGFHSQILAAPTQSSWLSVALEVRILHKAVLQLHLTTKPKHFWTHLQARCDSSSKETNGCQHQGKKFWNLLKQPLVTGFPKNMIVDWENNSKIRPAKAQCFLRAVAYHHSFPLIENGHILWLYNIHLKLPPW